MGKLNVPPTVDPATNGRKAPAKGDAGPETHAQVEEAIMSNPGPGSGRNGASQPNLSFNSKAIHGALK